jgi:hypothetical protein
MYWMLCTVLETNQDDILILYLALFSKQMKLSTDARWNYCRVFFPLHSAIWMQEKIKPRRGTALAQSYLLFRPRLNGHDMYLSRVKREKSYI